MDTNLLSTDINGILGDLSDLAFEKIKSSLKVLELPEHIQKAIYGLATEADMLNICIVGGLNSTDDIGGVISRTFGHLETLDKIYPERTNNQS
jgi:hypothetical protein